MSKQIFPGSIEYFVFILLNKAKTTSVGISGNENFLFEEQSKNYKRLIYFEKFNDRSKAVRRKKTLDKLDDEERLKLIRKKNPELLNLIFTVSDV